MAALRVPLGEDSVATFWGRPRSYMSLSDRHTKPGSHEDETFHHVNMKTQQIPFAKKMKSVSAT